MNTRGFYRGTSLILASLACTQVSAADLAIEEILVTGTKRLVSQQDLPIAVSTITSTQIENTFTTDITALTQLAPNVNMIRQVGFNAVGGGMRGTGFVSILVTKDPSVGVTVDDFAFNHVQSQFVELFDIEQVEVFRGPQGTLFGKNTTGGAIAFTTKKPILGEFTADVEGSYGQFASNDSNSEKLSAAVNIPISDTLAARLAVIKDKSDGYYSNSKKSLGPPLCLGCADEAETDLATSDLPFEGDGGDIGGKDVLAAKLKFYWEPSDFYNAHLTFEYLKDRSDTVPAANETPLDEGYLFPVLGFPGNAARGNNDPFNTGQSTTVNSIIDIDGGHQVDADGIYLTQTFNFDQFSLTSISGIRTQDEILPSTYTGEAYTTLFDASRNTEREQIQQEIRLTTEFDGSFNFVAGAAYHEDDLEFVVFQALGFVGLLPPFAGDFFFNNYVVEATTQDRESLAFYLDGSFDISDATTLTAGIRHTKDEKDFHRLTSGPTISTAEYTGPFNNPIPESAFGLNISDSGTFTANTFRVVLDHRLNEEYLAYTSFSTGFVAGGFSETCGSILSCSPYDDEENKSLEFGLKADLLDGDLRLNTAVFYTEYTNLQRDQVLPADSASGQETVSVNEGDTTAYGLELELTYLPTDNLRIDFNFGWLDHSYDDYSPGIDKATFGIPFVAGVDPSFQNLDLSDLAPPFSPEINAGLRLTYNQPLDGGSSMTYSVNAHYQDEAESQPFPAFSQGVDGASNPIVKPKSFTQMEERTLVDAYIGWRDADDVFGVTLYGKNLADEKWREAANAVGQLWNFSTYAPPRELGVRVQYNFK